MVSRVSAAKNDNWKVVVEQLKEQVNEAMYNV